MKVNIKKLNPGTWFTFKEDFEVCIRVITDDKQKKFKELCTEKEILNEKKFNEMMIDYCVVNWRGLYDEETDVEIPCTTENKMLFLVEDTEFNILMLKSINLLVDKLKVRLEEFEKNFSGS